MFHHIRCHHCTNAQSRVSSLLLPPSLSHYFPRSLTLSLPHRPIVYPSIHLSTYLHIQCLHLYTYTPIHIYTYTHIHLYTYNDGRSSVTTARKSCRPHPWPTTWKCSMGSTGRRSLTKTCSWTASPSATQLHPVRTAGGIVRYLGASAGHGRSGNSGSTSTTGT